MGHSPWGRKELDTTERLTLLLSSMKNFLKKKTTSNAFIIWAKSMTKYLYNMIQCKKYQFSFLLFHLSSVAIAINYDLFSGLYMDINFYIWKVEVS